MYNPTHRQMSTSEYGLTRDMSHTKSTTTEEANR